MESKPRKILRPRTVKLLKTLGQAFKSLRKKSGYGNSTAFAIAKDLPEGSYGKHEAGSENITLDSIVGIIEANGLANDDIFNKDFLALGEAGDENMLTEKSVNHLIDQLRYQVKLVSNEAKAYSFDDNDIKDMHNMLITGWSPASKRELFKKIGLNSKTPRFEDILDFLKKAKWMTMTNPDNLNDPGQQYYTTEVGKKALAANEPAATRPEKMS
ncbi:hypothetical protein FAZ15_10990 [Sphingobacterium olei]|uniref:HTH cro/C1-type domain-containing protein n=1 Tax=Sphingobacterium olei TaxID=2571155 RepID=A0A4U0P015_9SPHI|nr:hypothetical protein [Sphingobacterium olei]TJZ60517.1 hypothetical protein FAZ15_10990 [Sphingobacterium olei]